MTTFTRALTAEDIACVKRALSHIQAYSKDRNIGATDEELEFAAKALDTPVNGEALCMPLVCSLWMTRASDLGLPKKGAKREADREAYMQGVLTTLVACGLMDNTRANQIGFLCAVGRLGEYMESQAGKDVDSPEA